VRTPSRVARLALAGALACAAGASAQETGRDLPTAPPLPPPPPGAGTASPGAPVAGRNSFTADQARRRILAAGYADVAVLRLDENGIWRGVAVRAGTPVNVALDYQGNVTASR
jgi:hypothetical protein